MKTLFSAKFVKIISLENCMWYIVHRSLGKGMVTHLKSTGAMLLRLSLVVTLYDNHQSVC